MICIHRACKSMLTFLFIDLCAFWLSPSAIEVGPIYFLCWFAIFMTFFASQLFWVGRVLDVAQRFIPSKPERLWLEIGATALYGFFFLAFNFAPLKMLFTGHIMHRSDASLHRTLIDGVFSVWLVGSSIGFLIFGLFWIADHLTGSALWICRRARGTAADAKPPERIALHSSARRLLLRQIALAMSAVPFGAAAYGLLYERLNVEVTRRRIALARLPK